VNRQGPPLTQERRDEVERIVAALVADAATDDRMTAIGYAGSWARGHANMASDLDLVIVSDNRTTLIGDHHWLRAALGPSCEFLRTQDWGPTYTEVRYRTASGLEIEAGVVDADWAAIDPIDPGTAQVVGAGFVVHFDPHHILRDLLTAES
jgi:predicted nucleotidyltransferase